MRSRRPPALAVWLLDRLGLIAPNEPLAGDLLEEFQRGRTAGWYWRQTLTAVLVGIGQRIRTYRMDLPALVTGLIAEAVATVSFRLLNIPFGFHRVFLGNPALVGAWLALYLEYRVRLRAARVAPNDFDRTNLLRRLAFLSFIAFAAADGFVMRQAGLPWSEPAHWPSLAELFVWNVVIICLWGWMAGMRLRRSELSG